jgi:uncharacterized protein YfaS (alpha-2-macroglobulin family)
MALNRALKRTMAEHPMRAELKVGDDGDPEIVKAERTIKSGEDKPLWGKTLHVTNRGESRLAYLMLAEGTRLQAEKTEESKGMKIRRTYRDENGNELLLGNVVQGQLVVVTLDVDCTRPVDNLVVVDLLPAGFEVDNPRLQSRGRLGFTPPYNFEAAYQDFRDDRVLLFTTTGRSNMQFSYSVRAVAPGTYDVPALLAEAMYDPDIYGRFDYGTKLVVSPNKF